MHIRDKKSMIKKLKDKEQSKQDNLSRMIINIVTNYNTAILPTHTHTHKKNKQTNEL